MHVCMHAAYMGSSLDPNGVMLLILGLDKASQASINSEQIPGTNRGSPKKGRLPRRPKQTLVVDLHVVGTTSPYRDIGLRPCLLQLLPSPSGYSCRHSRPPTAGFVTPRPTPWLEDDRRARMRHSDGAPTHR